MGYQTLIDSNLVKAFNSVKDLAIDIVLTKKTDPTFNFGSGAAEFSTTQMVTTKAIVVETKKKAADRNSVEKQLMLKSKDVGDLNNYATIQLESLTWTVGDIQKNDGFISIVNVYREN